MAQRAEAQRQLGGLDVGAVVVGAIVGVGIFFAPATLARDLPSPSWMLGVWGLGGLVTLLGALVLADLGGRMPQAGGLYVFLREGYGERRGPLVAFLYGWANLLIVQPGALAIIALVLVANLEVLVGELPRAAQSGLGIAAIAGFSATNILGLKTGAGVQRTLTAAKVLILVALIGLGAAFGQAGFEALPQGGSDSEPWAALVAAGLIPVMFSFGGWQHGTWIGGVVKDPVRAIPRGILGGVIVVIAAYMAVNLAYLALLGQGGMQASQALAAEAGAVALGDAAGTVLAVAVVISAAGVLNTICLAFPWVIYAMSRDGVFVEAAGRLHPRANTPAFAIGLQGVLGSAAVFLGIERIDAMLAGLAFAEWGFYALIAVAYLWMRKEPGPEGGFSAPGWAAGGFALVAIGIVIGALVVKPVESAVGVGVLVAGLVVWRLRPAR